MQTETQAGLDTSKGFLRDVVELSQLMMREALQAARNGEDVDWAQVREVVREGRTAARQLAQIASLEVRDRALDLRERRETQKETRKATPEEPNVERDRAQFLEHSMNYAEQALKAVENNEAADFSLPKHMEEMLRRYGFDPQDEEALANLGDVLFPQTVAV